ncbi:hypothetical protein [Lentilitoribacter sp. EG35]|uniref:hypothetical protein n=1 Tax=Lentilitoribacter sp. EG35 TaxID=3234192 RepID=UPI0034617382
MTQINKYNEATRALSDPMHVCSRYDSNLNDIGITKKPEKSLVKNFFESWLMYMDGPAHKLLRKRVAYCLRMCGNLNLSEALTLLDNNNCASSLDKATIVRVVAAWHRELFGLTNAQQLVFLDLCRPLANFQHHGISEQNMPYLENSVANLEKWFQSQNFITGRAFNIMQTNGLSAFTCMGIAMDSFEPVFCALNNLLYTASESPEQLFNTNDDVFISEAIAINPPFARIIRRNTSLDAAKDRVVIDVQSCNTDICDGILMNTKADVKTHRSLSFGYGLHGCLGAHLVSEFLLTVLKQVKKTWQHEDPTKMQQLYCDGKFLNVSDLSGSFRKYVLKAINRNN